MKSKIAPKQTPLAIVGIGCIFPKAENLSEYWSNIVNGVDAITEIPETHWKIEDYYDEDPKAPDMTYSKRGGFIPTVDFNPMEFGIAPNAIEAIDTSQLLGLMVSKRTLEEAGYGLDAKFDRDKTSVIMGITGTQELVIPLGARLYHPEWRRALKEAGLDDASIGKIVQRMSESYVSWQESSFPGLLGNVVAGRIANYMDFGGTNCVTDTACASSLSAMHLAALELATGKSDMVLTGGVDTFNHIFMYMCFSKTPAMSPTGDARPFAHNADGTILGEGVGIVLLKRLEDAERDKDKIYAVVRGIGTSSDGKGAAVFAPRAEGQVKALLDAYRLADVDPRTIELMEAHGTGTKAGDIAESASISKVFKDASDDRAWCALGSVKSQIGHTKAAAGSASMIKAVLALYHKVLPPTIKVERPLEQLASDSPFYVNTEKRPWMPSEEHPRRAGVSAFGFGGSNFHCVVEEYGKEKTDIGWDGSTQIIALSAENIDQLKDKLDSWTGLSWKELCAKAGESRASFNTEQQCRLAMVVEKGQDYQKAVSNAKKMLDSGKKSWSTPDGAYFGSGPVQGTIGVLFPGQGSQYVGMLRDMACQFPQMHKVLSEANRSFRSYRAAGGEKDLIDYIYPKPVFDEEGRSQNEKSILDTRVAQPTLGGVSLGALKVLQYFGIKPDAFAGHSYGEITALCAAGCISEEDLHLISAERGKLMAKGKEDLGSMIAVQADLQKINQMIKENNLKVVVANKNSPTQIVLSGATQEIDKAAEIFSRLNIRNTKLKVSAAFHSPLVSKAQAPFATVLEKIRFSKAAVPVFSNTTAVRYPDDPERARALLAGQLAKPVQFIDEITNMHKSGVRTFVEVGPKTTLTGLVKNILSAYDDYEAIPLDASRGKGDGIYDLAKTLAQLAALGHNVELSLWRPAEAQEKKPKPKMTVPLTGANYVTPKPKKPMEPIKIQAKVEKMPKEQIPEKNVELLRATQQNIEALQRMQEQTARLHQQFLENQAAALQAYHVLAGQQPVHLPKVELPKIEMPAVRPAPPKVETATQPIPVAPKPVAPPPPAAKPKEDKKTAEALISIIAEKTGYPTEMLELDMNLDTDLGIDSIKRVEIFSALKDKVPAADQIKAEHMGTLKTLRDIVNFISNVEGAPAEAKAAPVAAPAPARADTGKTAEALISIIAEKTGYPTEMLELDMNLDTDLGIDSIKRVEIFSALKDKVPAADQIKAEHMGTLKTLRDIVNFISNVEGAPAEAKAAPVAAPAPAKPAEEASAPKEGIKRQVLSLEKLQERKERISIPEGSDVWITDDKSGLATSIKKKLDSLKHKPNVVSLADIGNLKAPSSLGGLLIIAPEKGVDDAFIRNSFKLLRLAAPALRKAKGAFVTVSRLDGAFGLKGMTSESEPLAGGLAGLSKTAFHEWPEVNCKAIDASPGFGVADEIVDEMFLKGPVEVALSKEGRFRIKLNDAELEGKEDKCPLKEGDVVLVTGGARGVTAECAIELARKKPTLVLLGRSREPGPEPEWLKPLNDEAAIKKEIMQRAAKKISPKEVESEYHRLMSNREILNNISRMESAGAKVVYRSVNVMDEEALKKAIKEFSPVKGLIHGAGVLADKKIEDKTDEEFDKVYGTKVIGLRNLLRALEKEDLKVLVLFSSSTARFGRVGQVDYAVSNEILNKIAQQQARLRPNCRVVSPNWGPWDGGMVTPALKKIFKSEGIDVIPLRAGAEYLVQEISSPENPVEIVILGSPVAETLDTDISTSYERVLSVEDYPILKSHVLNGRAVLPTALMIELLAHGAMHVNPGLVFHGFDDFRMLKGLKINGKESINFRVLAGKAVKKDDMLAVPVEFRSSSNGAEFKNAKAEIILTTNLPKDGSAISEISLPPYKNQNKNFYHNFLFHGPDLQGIEDMVGCSEKGVVSTGKTAPSPSVWIKKPLRSSWIADPLALDIGFQMMVIWSFENQGNFSLPSSAGRYRQYRTFPKGKVRIIAKILEKTESRVLANIEFMDQQGALIARMEDYECIADVVLKEAFANNHLA